jgi:hypothetical protein
MTQPFSNRYEMDRFLDGELSHEEMKRFCERVDEDSGLARDLREEFVLRDLLKGEEIAVGGVSPASRFGSRWLPRVAAAAVVILAFTAGRFSDRLASSTSPASVTELNGAVINATESSITKSFGDSVLRVHPGAQGHRLSNGFRLDGGTVEVEGRKDANVVVDGVGTLRISGHGILSYDQGGSGVDEAILIVQMLKGRARFLGDRNEHELVSGGELKVFERRGFRSLRQLVNRLHAYEGDENLTTLTASDWEQLLSEVGSDRESLESRVGALLGHNQKLSLELEARKVLGDSRRDPSIRDFLEVLAREDPNRGGASSRGGRPPQWFGKVRHFVDRYENRGDELVEEVERALLSGETTVARQRIGLAVLRHLRHQRAAEIAKRFLSADSDDLRAEAALALSSYSDGATRDALRARFLEDTSFDVRLAAASGLMGEQDLPEVLPWLMAEYRKKPRRSEWDRRRILARVFQAPFEQVSDFVVGVALDSAESRGVHQDILWMLRNLAKQGANNAGLALDFLSVTAGSTEVRMMASRYLQEL